MNPYAADAGYMAGFAADAELHDRLSFIRRTYLHVFGAILAFIALEAVYFTTPLGPKIAMLIGPNWWMALLGFIAVSWVAERWAHSGASTSKQYLGLALYVFAESIIFVPLLYIAQIAGPNIIPTAGFLTIVVFGSLTFLVFVTKQDFSFLRNFLFVGGIVALGVIFASMIFSFHLGIVFV